MTSEAARIDALRRGDAAAFERHARALAPALLRLARHVVKDEEMARAAVADAFERGWQCQWRFEGGLEHFLRAAVASAAARRQWRDGGRQGVPVEPLLPRFLDDGHHETHPPDWAPAAAPCAATRAIARRAFDGLPGDERAVLLLRDVAGLPNRETAARLDIDEGAARNRLRRARQALRALIEPRLRSGAL